MQYLDRPVLEGLVFAHHDGVINHCFRTMSLLIKSCQFVICGGFVAPDYHNADASKDCNFYYLHDWTRREFANMNHAHSQAGFTQKGKNGVVVAGGTVNGACTIFEILFKLLTLSLSGNSGHGMVEYYDVTTKTWIDTVHFAGYAKIHINCLIAIDNDNSDHYVSMGGLVSDSSASIKSVYSYKFSNPTVANEFTTGEFPGKIMSFKSS